MGRREEAIVVDADAMAKAGGTEGYAKTSEDIARHAFNDWKAGISRQGPRDLLHHTDRLLWNLEVLNLAGCGQLRLPSGLRGEVVALKERLSLGARTRLTRCRTVQDHVDAIFEVQKDLLSACVAQSLGDFGRKLVQASDDDD